MPSFPAWFFVVVILVPTFPEYLAQCPVKMGHSIRIFVLFLLNLKAEDD